MEEHGHAQHRIRRNALHGPDGMLPDGIEMMRVLLIIAHGGLQTGNQERYDLREGAEYPAHARAAEELEQLLPYALGGDPLQGRIEGADGGFGFRLDGEIQDGGEAEGPQDPQGVLPEAKRRSPDAADKPGGQIRPASVEIQDVSLRITGHGVDRKIPAGQILVNPVHKADRIGMAVIGIIPIDPIGCDFIGNMIQDHRQRSVFQAGFHQMLAGENAPHLLRESRGTQIPVAGDTAQERIPDAAAHGIGRKARGTKAGKERYDILRQLNHFTRHTGAVPDR